MIYVTLGELFAWVRDPHEWPHIEAGLKLWIEWRKEHTEFRYEPKCLACTGQRYEL
jgi:hypothetical protein